MIYALYNDVPQCLFLINLQEEKSRRSFSRAQDILRFIFLYQKYYKKFEDSLMRMGYLWRVESNCAKTSEKR